MSGFLTSPSPVRSGDGPPPAQVHGQAWTKDILQIGSPLSTLNPTEEDEVRTPLTIVGNLRERYGHEVSPDLVGAVTDAVLEEIAAWQARSLEPVIRWCSSMR